MAIDKYSITISYCSQVFWITNQNLDTGYFDSFYLNVYLRVLITTFVHVFLGCEFFSVFFCSEGDNIGQLKRCLNSEVISNSPKSRYGRFWGEQQVLQDVKESWKTQQDTTWQCRCRKAGFSSRAELDPVLPGMWTSHHVHKYLSHFCISIILKI